MRLLRFVVCNFAQIERLEIEFPLNNIALILGPNEAGKSHVVQALFGVLFGLPSSGRFAPWNAAGEEMSASLQFSTKDDIQVTLDRNFETNVVSVAEDGVVQWTAVLGDAGSAADLTRYNDLLVQWLGFADPEIFLGTGFVTQGRLADLDLGAITTRFCARDGHAHESLSEEPDDPSSEFVDMQRALALHTLAGDLAPERTHVHEQLLNIDRASDEESQARRSLEQSVLGEDVDLTQMVQHEREVHHAEQAVSEARLSPTATPPMQSQTTWWVLVAALVVGIGIGIYTLHQPRLFAVVLGMFAVLFVATGWRLGVLRSSPVDEVPVVRAALQELQSATDRRNGALATLHVTSLEQAVELREQYQANLRTYERAESMRGIGDEIDDLHARTQELDGRMSAVQQELERIPPALRHMTVEDLQFRLDELCTEVHHDVTTETATEPWIAGQGQGGDSNQCLLAISSHASDLLGSITRAKYVAIRINPHTFEVSVDSRTQSDIPSSSLSRAAQDQLYFSLRVALARYASGGVAAPLVLDDVFVNFDFVQMNRMMDVLRSMATDTQIVLFSCNSLYEQWFSPVARLPLTAL